MAMLPDNRDLTPYRRACLCNTALTSLFERAEGWARNTSEPLGLAGVNKVCDLGVGLLGIGDQSFLMSFSAACWASASEAKSSGVTTLRTVSS
jgi:hypothetical protein